MRGLQRFREYFSEYATQYVVIGGVAVHLLLEEYPVQARVTKDIDVVLIVEALDSNFVTRMWQFVFMGGYEPYCRSDCTPVLYRFMNPTDDSYPSMVELFSRRSLDHYYSPTQFVAPIKSETESFSLSAILLDDDYYRLALSGRFILEGIPILGPKEIILFKAKAFKDLVERRKGGYHVNSDDIRKHRTDILRLATVVDAKPLNDIPDAVRSDILWFVDRLEVAPNDLRLLGVNVSLEDIVLRLSAIYDLDDRRT